MITTSYVVDGMVVGHGRIPLKGAPVGATRGFVWALDQFSMIGVLPGLTRSAAIDINAFGLVVGRSRIAQNNPNASLAIIWRDGQLIDLNDLIDPVPGRVLTKAFGINDAGVIVAQGKDNGSVSFLLTPRDRPAADVDGDCRVDRADIEFVFRDWQTDQTGSDINRDGIVDALDFLAVLAGWSQD